MWEEIAQGITESYVIGFEITREMYKEDDGDDGIPPVSEVSS